MKKRLNLLLSVCMTTIVQSSCNKDHLTKETHKGANTLSCKVDNKIFKPYSSEGIDLFVDHYPVLTVGNCRSSNRFDIYARNQATDQNIFIEYSYISMTGVYKLREYAYRGIYDGGYADPGWYQTDSVYTGQLILTRCDTVNKIYSGTFSFTAKDYSGRIVQVTDGRFDLKE